MSEAPTIIHLEGQFGENQPLSEYSEEDFGLASECDEVHQDIVSLAVGSGGVVVKHAETQRTGAYIRNEHDGGTVFFEDGEISLVNKYSPQIDEAVKEAKASEPKRGEILRSGIVALSKSALLATGVTIAVSILPLDGERPTLDEPVAEAPPSPLDFPVGFEGDVSASSDSYVPADWIQAKLEELGFPDAVPVFGDGLPDTNLWSEDETFTYEYRPHGRYNADTTVDCLVGETHEVQIGDTLDRIGRENYTGETDSYNGPELLDLVIRAQNIEAGVVDTASSTIYPGDQVKTVEGCVATSYYNSGETGALSFVGQRSLGEQFSSSVFWRVNSEGELEPVSDSE